MALDELTRTVLLALLREADQWGELSPEQATSIARSVARSDPDARECLRKLHAVRLAHRDREANVVVIWTPKQRHDADVFAMTGAELARLETEVNGQIPGLTAAECEVL